MGGEGSPPLELPQGDGVSEEGLIPCHRSPFSPSCPSPACRPLRIPIRSDSLPHPWSHLDFGVPASPAPLPRAVAPGPALTRPAIFADTSGSAAAAGCLVKPAPAARARARPPPALAQARSRLTTARAPGHVPGAPPRRARAGSTAA